MDDQDIILVQDEFPILRDEKGIIFWKWCITRYMQQTKLLVFCLKLIFWSWIPDINSVFIMPWRVNWCIINIICLIQLPLLCFCNATDIFEYKLEINITYKRHSWCWNQFCVTESILWAYLKSHKIVPFWCVTAGKMPLLTCNIVQWLCPVPLGYSVAWGKLNSLAPGIFEWYFR